jgi:hypothetical protein
MAQTSRDVVKFTDNTPFDTTKKYTLAELTSAIGGLSAKMDPHDTFWALSQVIGQNWGLEDGSISSTKLAKNTIGVPSLDSVLVNNLVLQNNQSPINLSTKNFSEQVSSSVTGYAYVQGAPVTGQGRLRFSAVIHNPGEYTFFTASKVPDALTFTVEKTQTVTLAAGLVSFLSDLQVDGLTYYGMVIKDGSPMQRFGKTSSGAFGSKTVIDPSEGVTFTGQDAGNREQGFFASIDNTLNLDAITDGATMGESFVAKSARQTFSQGAASVVGSSTTSAIAQTLQGYDKDVWTFWGSRLAKKDGVSFNGFSTKVQLSSLDPKQNKYRFCGQVINLSNNKIQYSYYDIDPKVDYTKPTKVYFSFSKMMYLADGVVIGLSIVDSDGNVIKTNSTGVMLTDGLDQNLYDDGSGNLQHAIFYSNQTGSVKDIGLQSLTGTANPVHPYTGIEYELLSGKMQVSYALDDTQTNQRFSLVDDSLGSMAAQKIPAMKFRPAISNFSKVPDVYFLGRWFETDQGIMTINQGAEVDARFSGTSIAADVTALANLPCLAVSIDGGDFKRVQMTASGVTSLATGLSDGEHYVRLITDGVAESDDLWVGHKGIIFNGFVVDGDNNIETTPIKAANRVAWFIGDSITAGINVLGKGANPSVNSATHAYDFVCSELLNLVNIRVAFGATGMTKSGSGGVPAVSGYLDNLAQGISDTVVDYPDLIVINHGTNDSGATAATFVSAYRAALDRISVKLPGVPIFVMIPFGGAQSATFAQIVDGYSNVTLIQSDKWGINQPNAGHPDATGSLTAGQKLADRIQSVMGKNYFI